MSYKIDVLCITWNKNTPVSFLGFTGDGIFKIINIPAGKSNCIYIDNLFIRSSKSTKEKYDIISEYLNEFFNKTGYFTYHEASAEEIQSIINKITNDPDNYLKGRLLGLIRELNLENFLK